MLNMHTIFRVKVDVTRGWLRLDLVGLAVCLFGVNFALCFQIWGATYVDLTPACLKRDYWGDRHG